MPLLIFAQQDPQFTQNMFNHVATNPGYTGSQELIDVSALHRQSWMGFQEDNIMTSVLNINSPLKLNFLKNSEKESRDQVFAGGGIGFTIMQDQLSVLNKSIGFKGSFSAKFKAGDGRLAFGVSAGMINNTPSSITWRFPDSPDDNVVPTTFDPVLSFDLDAGIFYYRENVYFGISAMHLMRPTIMEADSPSKIPIHYNVTCGYEIQMGESKFDLIPSVFIQSDITTTQYNINLNLQYNKKVWGGVSYRRDDAISFIAGMELMEKIIIGYSYDMLTSGIGRHSSGSHEILVSYRFSAKKEKMPQKYKSVRFL